MATKDQEVLYEVLKSWNSGAGVGFEVPAIINMLQRLESVYGENFTIEDACNALDRLSHDARAVKNHLLRAKGIKTIEVYWDPLGNKGGQKGCFRARLREDHGIHDAGVSEEEAINNLLKLAPTLGESGNRADYEIVSL